MTQHIFDDFAQEFRRSSGVMTFTTVGIRKFADSISWDIHPDHPDPHMMISRSAPTDPGARPDAVWRKSEIEDAASPEGWLQKWISQAWLALIFSRWEDHYRPLFATAAGVEPKAVTCEVIGDVRHLRNDIIHNDGIAGKNARKCRILTRFIDGDEILIVPEDVWLLADNLTVAVGRG